MLKDDGFIIDVDKKDYLNNYTSIFLSAVNNAKNVHIVKSIMDYAKENNVKLNLREKNAYSDNPILSVLMNKNDKILQLLKDNNYDSVVIR